MIQSFISQDASFDAQLYKFLYDNLYNEQIDNSTCRALRYVAKRLESQGFPVDNRNMVIDQCFNVLANVWDFIKPIKQELFDDEQSSLTDDLIYDLASSVKVKVDRKKHVSVHYYTSNFENVYEVWKLRNRGMKS